MNNIDLNEIIRDGGYYDKLGQWNSVVRKPGSNHLYRQRVETLVIRNDDFGTGYVFVKKNGDDYDLPGGSIEPNVSDETQAANECHEEIHVDVKNIRYAYVDYESPIPENVQRIYKYPADYDSTKVFVADYAGPYTGEIKDVDEDPYMLSGQWYSFKECLSFFNEYHKEALMYYIREKQNKQTTESTKVSYLANEIEEDINSLVTECSNDPEVVTEGYVFNYFKNKHELNKYQRAASIAPLNLAMQIVEEMNRASVRKGIAKVKKENSGIVFYLLDLKCNDFFCKKVDAIAIMYLKEKGNTASVMEFPKTRSFLNYIGEIFGQDGKRFIKKSPHPHLLMCSDDYYKLKVEDQIFCILHELGHIVLGHLKIKNNMIAGTPIDTNLRRYKSILNDKDPIYPEKNADLFALIHGGRIEAFSHLMTLDEWSDKYDNTYNNTELTKRYNNMAEWQHKHGISSLRSGKARNDVLDDWEKTGKAAAGERHKDDVGQRRKNKKFVESTLLDYLINDRNINSMIVHETVDEIADFYKKYSWADFNSMTCEEDIINSFESFMNYIDMPNMIDSTTFNNVTTKLVLESLTKKQRDEIPLEEFGIPETRSYPLDTEKHVRSAIKLFSRAPVKYKKELANNILKACDKFGIDYKKEFSEDCAFRKYLNKSA